MPRTKQPQGGAETPARMISDKRVMEMCRHDFTLDEVRRLGIELSKTVQNVVKLENDKAVAVAEFGAAIKSANNDAKDLVGKIAAGFEMRAIECEVRYSTPQRGWKQIIRVDNGLVEREEQMTAAEMQIVLDFEKSETPASDKNVQ